MPLIELEKVEVGYHRHPILPPVTLRVEEGSFVGIVGPNGSGKTTLARTMLGLQRPLSGEIRFSKGKRPAIGYVPQRDQTDLSWPLTVFEAAMMGRHRRIGIGRLPKKSDHEAVARALDHVGIADLAKKPLHALSGGQRQRMLIARALAGEPDLLVLDEPTNGMDLAGEHAMLELIAMFPREKIAVIMISHQLAAVANYVRDLILVDRDRFVVEAGPIAEVLSAERLTALYRMPVKVAEDGGHKSVFIPREGNRE